ncbi:MAG: tryptophan-rich sensory protein [Clostridia bacterium]|nr:tryptophan-rich sensory protein [Clostridia bacterium]
MKNNKKTLIIALAIPLLVGGLAALLSGGMDSFSALNKPPLSPPGWLFPIVWTILYLAMGFASYLVATANAPTYKKNSALLVYAAQLIFNFFWPIIFFAWEAYLVAFIWLVILWLLILITIIRFYAVSKPAAYLMVPYLLWVTFAGYLNLAIYLLN